MNSLVSLRSFMNLVKAAEAVSVTANGATTYTGSFTWDGNTYSTMVVFEAVSGTKNLQLGAAATVGVLLVGGGGGGGSTAGGVYEGAGGGGAGGVVLGRLALNGNTTYTVSIGAAGTPAAVSTTNAATNGGNSAITGTGVGETAYGGARGGQTLSTGSIDSRIGPQGGSTGGNGGGSIRAFNVGAGGTSLMSQANCSTTSNAKTLSWVGNAGGTGAGGNGGIGGGGGGYGGAGAGGAAQGLGGAGYRFNPTGTSTPYSDIYVACGGCGGGSNNSPDQSSITSVGGVVGGNTSQPSPSNASTYGSGGSGAYGNNSSSASGASGMRGLCIVLVP